MFEVYHLRAQEHCQTSLKNEVQLRSFFENDEEYLNKEVAAFGIDSKVGVLVQGIVYFM